MGEQPGVSCHLLVECVLSTCIPIDGDRARTTRKSFLAFMELTFEWEERKDTRHLVGKGGEIQGRGRSAWSV